MAKPPTPESIVKRAICEYLSTLRDCLFWVNESQGTYDPVKKFFRKKNSPYQRNGTADILGIYQGSPLAIEVKSKAGKISDHQKSFLDDFQFYGGIAFVARSIDDVRAGLKIDQKE